MADRVGAFTTAADMIAWLADQYGLQSHPTPKGGSGKQVVGMLEADGPIRFSPLKPDNDGWQPIPAPFDVGNFDRDTIVQLDYGQGVIKTVAACLANWSDAIAYRLMPSEKVVVSPTLDGPLSHDKALEGWIEWKGGECPVRPGRAVEILCRNGIEQIFTEPSQVRWTHDPSIGNPARDVVAYRLV